MKWTIFRHNFGPTDVSYKYVVVNADRETAIEWWEKRYQADPTRYDGWYDTHSDNVWDITTAEDEEELLDNFPDIELDGEGIGLTKSRPTSMEDLREDNRILVMQRQAIGDDGVELPDVASEKAKPGPKNPDNAGVGERTGPPDHANNS